MVSSKLHLTSELMNLIIKSVNCDLDKRAKHLKAASAV